MAFFLCFAVCYHFSGDIYSFLAQPLADILEEKGGANRHLIFTQLYEAFFTYLKVAFFAAAFISFPVIATQIYLFVAPRPLSQREARDAAIPGRGPLPVLPGRRAGLLLRLPRRLALLPQLRKATTARAACPWSWKRRSANTSAW